MSRDRSQGYEYDPFAHSSPQDQQLFYTTPTPYRYPDMIGQPHHASPLLSLSVAPPSPSPNYFSNARRPPFPLSSQRRTGYDASPSTRNALFSDSGNARMPAEHDDPSRVPGIVPWQDQFEAIELRREGLTSRAELYDDSDGSDEFFEDENERNEDEDMLNDERAEEGARALGQNVGAMLDDEWETESDDQSGISTTPSAGSSAGSRWRGWESRTLLKSMFDLNVLDPNLKSHERDEIWVQVMKTVNEERGRQKIKGSRTDGACKHAWIRVFKAHCADQKISEIASGTDEEDGKWQRILDDLAALWNDVRDRGKKSKDKGKKKQCPSEKRRDKDSEKLEKEKEKDSEEEEDLDADVSLTPRAKKTRTPTSSIAHHRRKNQGHVDAFSDIATKQQEVMTQRLKQEEEMQKEELAVMERRRKDDRLAEDRRHDDLVMLEREKMKLDRQRTNESLQRMRQVEDKLQRYQQETNLRHEELQRDVRQSLQGQEDLKAMMTTLLQRLPG
ncbi:unnamed protein product [Tilletia controversa]|uniref:Myb-like domain-containing protein n=1 Tax=Tilletia caries TaxID=13290 RepID=A0ABN7IVR2_9BASI|nr:unnamed protein product [Tilletia caries]CAD6940455.1 unnamed protein product [Tilletia caries]CAD6982033.1 unnamed protein product [Tilletia controversa]CAD7063303.1 unnamed protein product [Tilletia caries]